MPESEERALSFVQVLTEEYKALRENAEWTADTEQGLVQKMDHEESPLSALCISGGGIRSATFALGAIQAFAEKGILADFDYLSTVSGGGYIGGWLTAWKQRPIQPARAPSRRKSFGPFGPRVCARRVRYLCFVVFMATIERDRRQPGDSAPH